MIKPRGNAIQPNQDCQKNPVTAILCAWPRWKGVLLLLLLPILPASVSWLSHAHQITERSRIGTGEVELSQAIAWQRQPGVLWVDTRSGEAFSRSHIPGAVLLNEDQWDERFPELFARWQPELEVVVYCDSNLCDASHQVADRLKRELQTDRVHVLHGGWQTWMNTQQAEPRPGNVQP